MLYVATYHEIKQPAANSSLLNVDLHAGGGGGDATQTQTGAGEVGDAPASHKLISADQA